MKRLTVTICIAWLLLMGQPGILFADYVMMCTFFQNPVARIYKVSDEGDITLDYPLEVGGNPRSLRFAPNGHWGLIGSHTTTYPPTQNTIVLGVDETRQISVLGAAHCEYEWLVAISPDSHYGVYGADLKTLRFSQGSYTVIPTNNPVMAGFEAAFSQLNNNFIVENGYKQVYECTLLPDGRTTTTGVIVDISPSTGWQDIEVSPDGRTCIVLSIGKYEFTVLQVHRQGGFSLLQQFESPSLNAQEVDFTPDSKFAIVSFIDGSGKADMRSYSIGLDSRLTEVDAINLPDHPGEDMAVTPDGKFAITRGLIMSKSYFKVVRIYEDGTLEYLPDRDYECYGSVSAIAFVPPYKTAVGKSWTMYK